MRTLEELMPPLTARSVALSLLLGMECGSLPVSTIVRLVQPLGFSAAAMRTALSRMVASEDLEATDGIYRLGSLHRLRQGSQEAAIDPRLKPDDADWSLVVIVVKGRDAATRADTRAVLNERRYAPLRPGVWLRPDNLADGLRSMPELEAFTVHHKDEQSLLLRLWNLPTWAAEAQVIIDALDPKREPATRFVAAAAAVRHLRSDPVLPNRLRPPDWPAERLRDEYKSYRQHIARLASSKG